MKLLISLIVIATTGWANAQSLPPAQASKQIAAAVKIFEPLAESGVQTFKLKPKRSTREVLLELAFQSKYISELSEFNWVGKSNDAWAGDSMAWGETDMSGAYSYIIDFDEQRKEWLDQPENAAEKRKMLAHQKKAKDNFKLLLKTGVHFGVVPMGAIQCGFTYAALAIIDPHTGKIYVFAKEGSGC